MMLIEEACYIECRRNVDTPCQTFFEQIFLRVLHGKGFDFLNQLKVRLRFCSRRQHSGNLNPPVPLSTLCGTETLLGNPTQQSAIRFSERRTKKEGNRNISIFTGPGHFHGEQAGQTSRFAPDDCFRLVAGAKEG